MFAFAEKCDLSLKIFQLRLFDVLSRNDLNCQLLLFAVVTRKYSRECALAEYLIGDEVLPYLVLLLVQFAFKYLMIH